MSVMDISSTFPGMDLSTTYTPVTCDTWYSMTCNDVLNAHRSAEETICISLGLSTTPQPVQFSNCGSSFDTTMRIYQNILDDWPISNDYCGDGDDCGECSNSNRENFIMPSLSHEKTIVLDAYYSGTSGLFQVEVNCGDQIEYPMFESTIDPFNPSMTMDDTINCDVSHTRVIYDNAQNYVAGYRYSYQTICIRIYLASTPQDIQFSNCQSSFDTKMSVWEDIGDASSVSYAECDYGDDDCGYCSNGESNRENFVLYSLYGSEYTIVLDAFSGGTYGSFKVEINTGSKIQDDIFMLSTTDDGQADDTTTTVEDTTTAVEDITTTEFQCPNVNAGLFNAVCQICLKNKQLEEICKDIDPNLENQYLECFKEICPSITCDFQNINVVPPQGQGICDCSNFQCIEDGNAGSAYGYRLTMNMMVIVLFVGYFVFQSV